MHALRYNLINGNYRHQPLLKIFSSQFLKSGNILWTLGRQFPVTTSTPILNGSQLYAGSLIQAKRNEKALKRIQKKMMRARSTLDWQSNNIFCVSLYMPLVDVPMWTSVCRETERGAATVPCALLRWGQRARLGFRHVGHQVSRPCGLWCLRRAHGRRASAWS